MGVDWEKCAQCGTIFPDCGDFSACGEGCSRYFCGTCDVAIVRYGYNPDVTFCPYCNPHVPGQDRSVDEMMALSFLLSKVGMTMDQVANEIKAYLLVEPLFCGKCKEKPQSQCNLFLENERDAPTWDQPCVGHCCACTTDDESNWTKVEKLFYT